MPTERISFAINGVRRTAELIYIDRHGHGVTGRTSALAYLHRVRQFPSRDWTDVAADYETRVLPQAISHLLSELARRRFDAALRPPSSRSDAEPYLSAIIEGLGIPRDWSKHIRRQTGVRAGLIRSCDKMFEEMEFKPPEDIASVGELLVVDESFSDGTTACALWRRLLDAGLSENCALTVVAPLRIVPPPVAPGAL